MVIDQNALGALLDRVETVTGKPMTDKQIARLNVEFNRLGAQSASMVVGSIERMENPPRNIMAAILNAIDQKRELENQNVFNKTKWEAQEMCCNPDEFELFFKLIAYIIKIHAVGHVKTNHEGYRQGTDIDTWIKAGRPKTWSPIVDHFLTGFERVYKNEKALTEYLKKYFDTLKERYK